MVQASRSLTATTVSTREQARQLLSGLPGRVTMPRVAVCSSLMESNRPLSHAELQEQLPRINRVSLYRALDWLEAQGLCIHLNGSDGIRRYAWQRDDHGHGGHDHHAHFQCQTCGTTECLEDIQVTNSKLPAGYQATGTTVIVHGQCPNCHD